jgi:protein-tyrosine phosphatase
MLGWIDLHCHWVAGIDDGARSELEGLEILAKLGRLGFSTVVATPHMRPGMFDNERLDLERAYDRMLPALTRTSVERAEASRAETSAERDVQAGTWPAVHLSSEHYFDDVVVERILRGDALPYPGGKAILLEFYEVTFSYAVERSLFAMQRQGLTPVIAHPERYRPFWTEPERLERLVELGAVALLDACSVVGKYGQQVRRCALELLERETYGAACSDAHRPEDVDQLAQALDWLRQQYGADELEFLFGQGPRAILAGTLP